jgi:hypothetical protein
MGAVELYKFTAGANEYHYTSGRRVVTYGGDDYEPAAIKRSRWKRTLEDNEIRVDCPSALEPIDRMRGGDIATVIWLNILNPDTGVCVFSGRVVTGIFDATKASVELRVANVATALRGDCPNERFGPTCRYMLGDDRCGVDLEDFKVTVATSGIVAFENTLTASAIDYPATGVLSESFFQGGYALNGTEKVFILSHSGNTVYLLQPFTQMDSANTHFYPGCTLGRGYCVSIFSNGANFGGAAFAPRKNPVFDGF